MEDQAKMTKRVKLKIQRNRLPDVDILWPLKEQDGRQQCTISSLLTDVNNSVPLESGDWTLDQYLVELDGFECLHYQFLSDVLKDGDNVTIRPLTTPDVKARRLGGRTQITSEGFHIVDGVPYGMQPHQRPARPGILIPSRKRRRPEMEEGDNDGEVTIADMEDDEELLEHVNTTGFQFEGVEEEEDAEETRPKKKQKNVHFKIVKDIPGFEVEEEDGDEDSEDDEDFDPDGDEESDSEGEDLDVEDARAPKEPIRVNGVADGESDSTSSSDVSSTSSEDESDGEDSDDSSSDDSDSDASSASAPEVASARHPPTTNGLPPAVPKVMTGIPYNGSQRTKDRNGRRKYRKRLLARIRAIIGYEAEDKVCDEWLRSNPKQAVYVKLAAKDELHDEADGSLSEEEEEEVGDEIMLDEDIIGLNGDATKRKKHAVENGTDATTNGDAEMAGVEVMPNGAHGSEAEVTAPTTKSKSSSFEQRRNDLLSAISSGGIANTSSSIPTSIIEAEKSASAMSTPTDSKRGSPATEVTSAGKRIRLDINGSRRAIFGSLGQRTPKTQEDAEKVRNRLARLGDRGKKTDKSETKEAEQQEDEDPLSDAWRSKIKLMAVDCDDPSIELSEPPYPFRQRWDESQQMSAYWLNGGKKHKKKRRNNYGHGDGNWEGEEGSYLEYDEEAGYEGEEEEEYADGEEELAEFAESQLLSEAGVMGPDYANDLPSLPADLSTLPPLTEEDLKPGAVITYRQLEVTQATSWSPTLSAHRTAKVISTSTSNHNNRVEIIVELAMRDRDVKDMKYDAEGRRMYDKFEMDDGDEEDGDDDGMRELGLGEMVEGKLVRAAVAEEVMREDEDVVKGEDEEADGGVVG
jgi:hypothetical protein